MFKSKYKLKLVEYEVNVIYSALTRQIEQLQQEIVQCTVTGDMEQRVWCARQVRYIEGMIDKLKVCTL